MKTPIRYAGGKSKAYKIISEYIPRLPYPSIIIYSFIGGGSLESRCESELGIPVYGYDIFDALVNFWQVLLDNPIELANRLQELEPTKEKYNEIKEILRIMLQDLSSAAWQEERGVEMEKKGNIVVKFVDDDNCPCFTQVNLNHASRLSLIHI